MCSAVRSVFSAIAMRATTASITNLSTTIARNVTIGTRMSVAMMSEMPAPTLKNSALMPLTSPETKYTMKPIAIAMSPTR